MKKVCAAPGDFPGQVRATWENMRRVLATAGGSVDDIVTMTVYTTERRWGEISGQAGVIPAFARKRDPESRCKGGFETRPYPLSLV